LCFFCSVLFICTETKRGITLPKIVHNPYKKTCKQRFVHVHQFTYITNTNCFHCCWLPPIKKLSSVFRHVLTTVFFSLKLYLYTGVVTFYLAYLFYTFPVCVYECRATYALNKINCLLIACFRRFFLNSWLYRTLFVEDCNTST
jgi:hypothetical protein